MLWLDRDDQPPRQAVGRDDLSIVDLISDHACTQRPKPRYESIVDPDAAAFQMLDVTPRQSAELARQFVRAPALAFAEALDLPPRKGMLAI